MLCVPDYRGRLHGTFPCRWTGCFAQSRPVCENQSEFIEKAIRFYAGYVTSKNGTEFLAPILVSALQGTVENAENHIARLLFKLAVETNMMMNVLASEVDVSAEALERLRGRCIQEVKKTGGAVTFADAMKYQHGE